jgi:hypothetical protein
MFKFIRILLVAGIIGCLTLPAFGKYYQYTDTKGVLRFTDDLANVPKGQRPNMKTYKSVKGNLEKGEPGSGSAVKSAPKIPTTEKDNLSSTGSWNKQIAHQRDELNRRQAELNKLFMKLQNERTALAAKAPPTGTSSKRTQAYRQQVEDLNARIDQYEKQRAEFAKKVAAFNAKFKK